MHRIELQPYSLKLAPCPVVLILCAHVAFDLSGMQADKTVCSSKDYANHVHQNYFKAEHQAGFVGGVGENQLNTLCAIEYLSGILRCHNPWSTRSVLFLCSYGLASSPPRPHKSDRSHTVSQMPGIATA